MINRLFDAQFAPTPKLIQPGPKPSGGPLSPAIKPSTSPAKTTVAKAGGEEKKLFLPLTPVGCQGPRALVVVDSIGNPAVFSECFEEVWKSIPLRDWFIMLSHWVRWSRRPISSADSTRQTEKPILTLTEEIEATYRDWEVRHNATTLAFRGSLTVTDVVALKRAIGGALVCTFLTANGRCAALEEELCYLPMTEWRHQHPKARDWQDFRKETALEDAFTDRYEAELEQTARTWGLSPMPETWFRPPVSKNIVAGGEG